MGQGVATHRTPRAGQQARLQQAFQQLGHSRQGTPNSSASCAALKQRAGSRASRTINTVA